LLLGCWVEGLCGLWARVGGGGAPPREMDLVSKREFFIDNLLVRIHRCFWWTVLAPWEFEFPFPGSLTSTFQRCLIASRPLLVPLERKIPKAGFASRRSIYLASITYKGTRDAGKSLHRGKSLLLCELLPASRAPLYVMLAR